MQAMSKRIMKRRELIVKNLDLERVTKKQGKVNFSIACWALSEYSKSSGLGDEAASIVHIFYESKDPRPIHVFRPLRSKLMRRILSSLCFLAMWAAHAAPILLRVSDAAKPEDMNVRQTPTHTHTRPRPQTLGRSTSSSLLSAPPVCPVRRRTHPGPHSRPHDDADHHHQHHPIPPLDR